MGNVLLTGGAGFIGSHAGVVLAQLGHNAVFLDNFTNSSPEVLGKIGHITGRKMPMVRGDVRDTGLVREALKKHQIDSVIHFAGLKAVGESVEKPVDYYASNVQGTISLLQAMSAESVKTLIFSSSATVYGQPQCLPLDESHPTCATNPYGRSKLHIEEMLADLAHSDPEWRIVCLRYFNPVGAHESGLIGENAINTPNNLMPYISQVASGHLPELIIFGNDYSTPDGTGVRDYIHVMDLAEGHAAALSYLESHPRWCAINLGTGKGISVLQMVQAFERASNQPVPFRFSQRREGDVAESYASSDKARQLLGWQTKRSLEEMCASTWKYQKSILN